MFGHKACRDLATAQNTELFAKNDLIRALDRQVAAQQSQIDVMVELVASLKREIEALRGLIKVYEDHLGVKA